MNYGFFNKIGNEDIGDVLDRCEAEFIEYLKARGYRVETTGEHVILIRPDGKVCVQFFTTEKQAWTWLVLRKMRTETFEVDSYDTTKGPKAFIRVDVSPNAADEGGGK